ncbi:zinc ribbon domain-containing protein [Hungatella hathewayi]|nr:zinc ribbon domain-containing protein [Hungatella hathewayi]
MPLSVRRYECNCGMSMDRDLNAAINIRNRGYEIYLKAA